jgi:N-acyl homoserine lactone hydrolase
VDRPTPLEAPLPGGCPGATVRLWPLLTGGIVVPLSGMERPPGRLGAVRALAQALTRGGERVEVPVLAYLVEHPQAGLMLVDTGFDASVAADPTPNLGWFAKLVGTVLTRPEQSVPAQLTRLGRSVGDVSVVVLTHLHWDHASALRTFGNAAVVVDGVELRTAEGCGRGLLGYSRHQIEGPIRWRAVDYSAAPAHQHGPFERTIDLFGDGSVRLLSTPGHTPGHQSVLLRLADRRVLLAGDAAYTRRTLSGQVRPLLVADPRRFRDSLERINRYAADRPGTLVVPGHDPDAWPGLASTLAG